MLTWIQETHSEVAGLTTVVATSAGCTSRQTKSGTVSLDVSQALTVVALFGWECISLLSMFLRSGALTFSRTWVWAPV